VQFRVVALLALATLGSGWVVPLPARAETVIEHVARTGELTMGGTAAGSPYSFLNGRKELVGYSMDVARLIAAEVSAYLGKPVKLAYMPSEDQASTFRQVSRGEVDLSCGAQFTWEREMFVDFSLPYSLSGIRLLTRTGSLDGYPASMAGRRIGVVAGSLGESTIAALQPKAVRVPMTSVDAAVKALLAGKVDGVAGDSILLAASLRNTSAKGYGLVPDEAYSRYAVGCILPENNSTFRNLVNLAIAKLLQGYLNGDPTAVATVDRWVGPSGILGLPPEVIRLYFQTVLLNHEQIQLPAAGATKSSVN